MRIRQRLWLGFLGVVVIFILFGGYLFSVWQAISTDMAKLDQTFEETSEHTVSELESTLHMTLQLETTRRALHEYVLNNVDAAAELVQSLSEFDRYYVALRSSLIDEQNESITVSASTNDAESLSISDAIVALDEIEASHEEIQSHVQTVIGLIKAGRTDAAMRVINQDIEAEAAPVFERLLQFEESIEAHTQELTARFDVVIHTIEDRIRRMQTVTIVVLGISILFAFVMGYYTSEAISEPIERLAEAAVAVETGSYELDSLAGLTARGDELGQFARTFEQMARQVYAREQQLKAQVSALQIEIDRAQGEEQVTEITDTDFFKDLQSKARAMRASKKNL